MNPLHEEKIKKTCPTCHKSFLILFPSRSKQIHCSRKCASNNCSVIEKIKTSQKNTYALKYNGKHPMQIDNVVEKYKNSIIEKYGKEYWKTHLVKKSKTTKLKRYGDSNYRNVNKYKNTCLLKYGVDNIKKIKKPSSFSAIKLDITKNKLDYNETKCHFYHYLQSYNKLVIQNESSIIHNRSLDFYIPDIKTAIDLNGLYSNGERSSGNIKRFTCLNKLKNCLFHGIKLITIFENEWVYKQNIIKSLLNTVINNDTREPLYAKNCTVGNVNNKEKQIFLNSNHIKGDDLSSVKLGLYYNNTLISIMCFNHSRFDKKYQWELTRFCDDINYNIIDSAGVLFDYFIKAYTPNNIIAYSDRRLDCGNILINVGFKFMRNIAPGYNYISKNYKTLCNRLMFTKKRQYKLLEKFDINLTEWENMQANGFDRIWDCGCSKWIWMDSDCNQSNFLAN